MACVPLVAHAVSVCGIWQIREGADNIAAAKAGSRKQSNRAGREHRTGGRKQRSKLDREQKAK